MRLLRVGMAAALSLAAACGGGDDASPIDTPSIPTAEPATADDATADEMLPVGALSGLDDLDALLALSPIAFDEGALATFDDGGDGSDDRAVLSFAPVEIGTTTVTRTVELVEGDAVTITIGLTGDGPYEHVERIPKSFATNIADVTFNVEPDEVVDPDPTVKWLDGIIDRAKGELEASIGWDKLAGGPRLTLSDVVEQLDETRFVAALDRVRAAAAEQNDRVNVLQLLELLGQYPEHFQATDCNAWFDEDNGGATVLACRAVLTLDIGACDQAARVLDDDGMLKWTAEQSAALCRKFAGTAEAVGCLELTGSARDECLYSASRWSSFDCCSKMNDPITSLTCRAEINQDPDFCVQLSEREDDVPTERLLACCDTIEDDAKRATCREAVSGEPDSQPGEPGTATPSLTISFEPYALQLETGQDYEFSFDLTPPRDRVIYHIDWGDGIETASYDPSWTHRYDERGTFTVRVEARDEVSDELIAAGELTIEVDYPYDRLELLQSTTKLFTRICGVAAGMSECADATGNDGTIDWSGRTFTIDVETRTGEISKLTFHAEGEVNEDATEIFRITAHTVLVIGFITTDVTFAAANLPLEPDDQIPTIRTDDYVPVFRAYLEGAAAVRDAVVSVSGSRTDATGTTPLDIDFDDAHVATINVIFS